MERPTLFLHTEPLDDEVRAKLATAGYLPVRVEALDNVKLVEQRVSLSRDVLDAIGQAALTAVVNSSDSVMARFAANLARLLKAPAS